MVEKDRGNSSESSLQITSLSNPIRRLQTNKSKKKDQIFITFEEQEVLHHLIQFNITYITGNMEGPETITLNSLAQGELQGDAA